MCIISCRSGSPEPDVVVPARPIPKPGPNPTSSIPVSSYSYSSATGTKPSAPAAIQTTKYTPTSNLKPLSSPSARSSGGQLQQQHVNHSKHRRHNSERSQQGQPQKTSQSSLTPPSKRRSQHYDTDTITGTGVPLRPIAVRTTSSSPRTSAHSYTLYTSPNSPNVTTNRVSTDRQQPYTITTVSPDDRKSYPRADRPQPSPTGNSNSNSNNNGNLLRPLSTQSQQYSSYRANKHQNKDQPTEPARRSGSQVIIIEKPLARSTSRSGDEYRIRPTIRTQSGRVSDSLLSVGEGYSYGAGPVPSSSTSPPASPSQNQNTKPKESRSSTSPPSSSQNQTQTQTQGQDQTKAQDPATESSRRRSTQRRHRNSSVSFANPNTADPRASNASWRSSTQREREKERIIVVDESGVRREYFR
jgi:hypothetical protein